MIFYTYEIWASARQSAYGLKSMSSLHRKAILVYHRESLINSCPFTPDATRIPV